MITLKNLTVMVNEKIIIKKINFTFEKGKIYALMGPNGSGKSTLAFALMGHPAYKIISGEIIIEGKNINNFSVEKRANIGIFLSFQSPLTFSGINVFQLLRLAIGKKKDVLKLENEINKYSKILKISKNLIERSLNDGASGGEKKKMEILQAAVINPKFIIFDEIDTGIDIDALKNIAEFIRDNKKEKTYLLITHYNRILKYIKPDKVLIMVGGRLVKISDYRLAEKVEKFGYKWINNL